MTARLLLSALLAALAGAAMAQPAAPSALEPQFAAVPVPRDVVGSLAQDRQGLIWIGTSDGLARFDGYRLRPIEREGATPVQRNLGWVRSLAAAADGGMWIGTEVNGLARYEPAFDRVRVLGSGSGSEHPTPIRALAEDGGGQVWVGTLGQGLLRYEPKTGRFETEALEVNGEPERRVLALAVAGDGSLWAGHWRGLARRDAKGGWTPLTLPDGAIGISTLLEDREGRLWFGSVDGRVGRLEADGQPRWLAARFKGGVQALAQGADGIVWAGLTDGIAWLDGGSGALLRQLRHNPHLPGGLAGNDVNVLLRDQTGAMWAGGYGVGLQRHQQHPALAVRGPDADPGSPLASSDLRGLLSRRDGLLMVATHSGPVALLDAQLRTVGRWPREADTPVDNLAEGPDGSIWLVANGRLERREPRTARLLAGWALEGGRAHRVLALPNGEVWVGMQDGLYRLASPQARRVERMRRADGEPLRGGVHALRADPAKGQLWVGALAGLFRWDGQRLAEVQGAPGEALGFPAVLGLLQTRDGSLYVDTAVSGLHRLKGYDEQGRARFERISERMGAPGRPFGVNLHEDAKGRVWSQQSVYDPIANRLDELSGSEGPPMGTPRFFADTALPDGRLLFSGSRGLLVVEPLAFMPSRYAPPVVISSLRRNGQLFQPEQDLKQGLKLPAGTRSFAIEFAALDYIDPVKLRYMMRLDGWDSEWTFTDASARFASYGGLQPGRYRLEVYATNHHGMWGDRPLLLDIELLPAWWQTRWAQAIALLVLLGLGWVLLRWTVARRTAQLRRRETALQALVDQRTAELREASTTDPLTGLRNRRYLDSRVASDLQLCLRHYTEPRHHNPDDEADLLVVLMDLDHFKRINDRHGHAAGDQVLTEFARRLRSVFRESDVLVRWGGEEFLALARGGARSGATELAQRFCAAIRDQPFTLADGRTLSITVSIGFAVFPLDPEAPRAWDWDATLSLADAALYAAKAQGRDGYVGALRADGLRPDELGPDTETWMNEARLQVRRNGTHLPPSGTGQPGSDGPAAAWTMA